MQNINVKNEQMKTTYVILALGASLAVGCGDKRQEPQLRSVMVVAPAPVGVTVTKSFAGVVREAREIGLGFKTPGQISRMAVSEGDRVRRGQLIATLDDADYRLGVEAVQVQYDQMARELRRLERLHSQKSLSDNDYEKARAGLEQLRIQLQTNKNKLDYTRLYAPVDGIIDKVNFDKAEMVNAGTPVVTLLDVSGREVEVDVPVGVYLAAGCIGGVTCRSAGAGGSPAVMKVLSLTPKADANQLYRLRLGFADGQQRRFAPGMNVEVDIRLTDSTVASAYSVPARAVFQDSTDTYVWTVGKDGKAHKAKVCVSGVMPDGGIVISSGLNGGERVVRAGVNALRDGEQVRVISEGSPTNVGNLL